MKHFLNGRLFIVQELITLNKCWKQLQTTHNIYVFFFSTFYLFIFFYFYYIYLFIYTPQNNLRTTSFISPLIITKMRPSSFTIISWTKLEVSALFQSAQHVRTMFSYKSVNGTNNARPKDSKKTGISKKGFLPQNEVFSRYWKNSLFNENNTLSHTKSCKINLHSFKRHTDMARKINQHFKRLKMPRNVPRDNE